MLAECEEHKEKNVQEEEEEEEEEEDWAQVSKCCELQWVLLKSIFLERDCDLEHVAASACDAHCVRSGPQVHSFLV